MSESCPRSKRASTFIPILVASALAFSTVQVVAAQQGHAAGSTAGSGSAASVVSPRLTLGFGERSALLHGTPHEAPLGEAFNNELASGARAAAVVVPVASGLPWSSGVFVTTQSPRDVSAFAAWRRHSADVVVLWPGRRTWSDFTNPTWLYAAWASRPETKVLGIPMIPEEPTTSIKGCAAGSYDAKWREFARGIKGGGMESSTIIRLGWEFNGDWYRWSAWNPSMWTACWRRVFKVVEAIAPGLRWDWTVNRGRGSSVVDPRAAWPGDAYVDVVGVDSYDMWPTVHTDADWDSHLRGAYGLQAWYDFAVTHGKAFSVPEWGVLNSSAQPGQGGDNPFYVRKMQGFFRQVAGRLAYESYFNHSGKSQLGAIFPPVQNPQASTAYLSGLAG